MKLIGNRIRQVGGHAEEVGFRLDAPEADRLTHQPDSGTVLLGDYETKTIHAGASGVTWFQIVEDFAE